MKDAPADAQPIGKTKPITGMCGAIPANADDSPTEEIDLDVVELAEEAAREQATQSAVRRTTAPPPPPPAAIRTQPGTAASATTNGRDHAPAAHASSGPAPLFPPFLGPSRRAQATSAAAAQAPALDPDGELARVKRELDRLTKRLRERDAYLAELEAGFAQRSEELVAAQAREAALQAQLNERAERIAELERALRDKETLLSQHTLHRRPSSAPPLPLGDDLTKIRGIGLSYERALRGLGMGSFSAIAAWTAEDIARVGQQLKITPGRIERDRWVEQAAALVAGKPLPPAPAAEPVTSGSTVPASSAT